MSGIYNLELNERERGIIDSAVAHLLFYVEDNPGCEYVCASNGIGHEDEDEFGYSTAEIAKLKDKVQIWPYRVE